MKIDSIKILAIPEIKVIKFSRFMDHRGYFTEPYSIRDFISLIPEINLGEVIQINESFSKNNTIRGLHFQWNPYMGKLIRTVRGHMIDLILDIRLNSPTFGKIIGYNMASTLNDNFNEWIWIPAGFAHGNVFLEDTIIQYLCNGEYNWKCESGISPIAADIDWSLCDSYLKYIFYGIKYNPELKITDKDKNAFSLEQWKANENSKNFIYV
jgi:dTDP-4-dehydrorhamnose 3,5-epimerase